MPTYRLSPLFVNSTGMLTFETVPGLNFHVRTVLRADVSSSGLPVLCPIEAPVTLPLASTDTTQTPLPQCAANGLPVDTPGAARRSQLVSTQDPESRPRLGRDGLALVSSEQEWRTFSALRGSSPVSPQKATSRSRLAGECLVLVSSRLAAEHLVEPL